MKHQRVLLTIHGLTYGGGGALAVEQALERTPGVVWASVNAATEMAYVEYDPLVANLDLLMASVERAGFRAGEPSAR